MSRLSAAWRYAVMLAVTAVFLGPMAVMVAASLKGSAIEIVRDFGDGRAFWAHSPTLANYRQVLAGVELPFLHVLGNTAIVVAGIVGLGIVLNSMFAYALARLDFGGRGWILATLIALIIIPLESVAVPLLLLVNRLGWVNSYHVQIVPFIAHPFSIFLFYQFFLQLPREIDEAAICDGARPWTVYWRIVMPLSKPVIVTVVILTGLEYWNSFLWPLMTTRGPEYQPLSVAVSQYFDKDPKLWGEIMAFSVMSSLPVLVLFLAFQRWFVRSIAGSAVKG